MKQYLPLMILRPIVIRHLIVKILIRLMTIMQIRYILNWYPDEGH